MDAETTARRLSDATTFLFVPGDRPDRFQSAWASRADVVILDLEASVHPDRKETARESVAAWLATAPDTVAALVRFNRLGSEEFSRDWASMSRAEGIGLMLSGAEYQPLRQAGFASEPQRRPLVPLVETAQGVEQSTQLAAMPGVCRLAFGNMDYETEMGLGPGHLGFVYPASRMAVASRCANLAPPIAGVTAEIRQREKLLADIAVERSLGFAAKMCIHPCQVQWAHEAYAVSEEELAWARGILAATSTSHAVAVNGQMIDRPVIERARRLLARASRS